MRLARPLAFLTLAALLAGCASDGDPGAPPTATDGLTGGATGCAADCQTFAPLPRTVVDNVSVDGHVGAQAYVCHPDVPDRCAGAALTTEDAGFLAKHDGLRLVAANLTVTWVADGPATETLTVEVRLLEPGNATFVASATGPSPLVLREDALSVAMAAGSTLRAFVYNAGGYVPAGGGFVYATPDQAVHMEGTLTFAP